MGILFGRQDRTIYQHATIFSRDISNPQTICELKLKIQEEIATIPPDMIRRVMENFRLRLERCVDRNGDHRSSVISLKILLIKLIPRIK